MDIIMFIQPCFIRKNTEELRNELNSFGYHKIENGVNEWHIPIEKCTCLTTGFSEEGNYIGVMGLWENISIDCGTNEDMFLALAALRDDSDKYQWFVSDEGTFRYSDDNIFDLGMANYINYIPTHWHKATVKEILEHFKNK